jgi:tetratricopeptide (TPR) repeat protein
MIQKQPDVLGFVGLSLSIIGAVASIHTKSFEPVSIGSTIGIGCNLFSRKQSNDALIDGYNLQEQKIDDLIKKLEFNRTELSESLTQNKAELANKIEELTLNFKNQLSAHQNRLTEEVSRLDLQNQELSGVVSELQSVENLSQELRVKPDSAEFFYQRGVSHEKLGNKVGAIEDYNQAIKIKPNLAKAYHKRGVVYLENGAKQKAIDDLRKAALLYFEQGDIESYHQAREMSRNIHQLHGESNGTVKEMVVGSQLFDVDNN